MNNIIAQRGNSCFLVEIKKNEFYALLDVSTPHEKPIYSTTPDTFYRFGYFTDYVKDDEVQMKVDEILRRFEDEKRS